VVNHHSELQARGSVGQERRDRPALLVNRTVRASRRAALGLALVATAAGAALRESEPAIEVRRGHADATAAARQGAVVRLALAPGLAPSWREANIGLLAVRSEGLQKRLDATSLGAELEVPVPQSGCALFVADLGRPEDRGFADSWRRSLRSVKAVFCSDDGAAGPDLDARRRSAALLMARAGTRDEVRPLANPATARPGSDLPLRVYADGREAAGVKVTAQAPDGAAREAVSDANGFVTIALPLAGPWRIHFRAAEDRVAELLFEVPQRPALEVSP
jgi:hypothetical protein